MVVDLTLLIIAHTDWATQTIYGICFMLLLKVQHLSHKIHFVWSRHSTNLWYTLPIKIKY